MIKCNYWQSKPKKIALRKEISERIYNADFRFNPIINHIYYLYENTKGIQILSMIEPNEWGRVRTGENYTYLVTIKLLADYTWEILDNSDEDLFNLNSTNIS